MAGLLATGIMVGALGIAAVMQQRRVLALHRAWTRRLLAAQEEERARVAREVHDGAVHHVALIRAECEAQGPELRSRLAPIMEELSELSTQLRGLAHGLHPATLSRGGVAEVLASLCDDMYRGHGLSVIADVADPATPLPQPVLLTCYRVAQEALQNVAKHAGVSEARLSFLEEAHRWTLGVEDRGAGFEAGSRPGGEGIGLLGMRERAALVGGSIAIQSAPGQGTRVRLSLPRPRD